MTFSLTGGTTILSWCFGTDHTPKLWDPSTGLLQHDLKGHTKLITKCAFSPSGTTVLSASLDSTLMLWSSKTGVCLRTMGGHLNAGVTCFSFLSDDKTVVSGWADNKLRTWNCSSGLNKQTLEGGQLSCAYDCCFDPSGKAVFSVHQNGFVKTWI
jgi:WD40 repeat protein